jgi:outer membrane lipoprotein-sorting protein
MKKLTSIILFISILFISYAQNHKDTDQGASQILENVLKKYNSFSTMSIDFSFKSEKNNKVILSTIGTLVIKGRKYYATFDKQIFACDSNVVWNYQKEGNEVTIYEYDEAEAPIFHPTKFITNWKKEFNAKFIREEVSENKTLQIIDLTPIKSTSYFKIRILIDKNKNEIIKTQIFDKDSTIFNYTITKMITNSVINDASFKFVKEKFPNVIINDMR